MSFKFLGRFLVVFALVAVLTPSKSQAQLNLIIDETLSDANFLQSLAKSELDRVEKKYTVAQKINTNRVRAVLGKASYLVARSKAFLGAKTKILAFDYPDAVVFSTVMRIARFTIVYPLLVSLGHPELAAAAVVMPDTEIADTLYLTIRSQVRRWRVESRTGVKQSLVKQFKRAMIEDIDLNSMRLHVLEDDEKTWIIPVKQTGLLDFVSAAPESSRWISVRELEGLVGETFLKVLISLDLDSAIYENVLLQKVFSEPALSARFWARHSFLRTSDFKKADSVQNFFLQSELFLERMRAEADRHSKSIISLSMLTKSDYRADWWHALKYKFVLAKAINRIRMFQISMLGESLKDPKHILPENAWTEFATLKASAPRFQARPSRCSLLFSRDQIR